MTTFELELKKRDISPYRFTQLLGYTPSSHQTLITRKMRGLVPISPRELKHWCDILSLTSNEKISPEDVTTDIVAIKVK